MVLRGSNLFGASEVRKNGLTRVYRYHHDMRSLLQRQLSSNRVSIQAESLTDTHKLKLDKSDRMMLPESRVYRDRWNAERYARAKKRLSKDRKLIVENASLCKSFENQRNRIASFFLENKDGGASLFETPDGWKKKMVNSDDTELPKSYEDLKKVVLNGRGLAYYPGEIQNSILCIINHFLNTFLVDLNVRSAFDQDLNKMNKESFLLRRDLFRNIKDLPKRDLILEILSKFYETNKHGKPGSIEEFIHHLDQGSLNSVLNKDALETDSFKSVQFYRYNFDYYKTSQYHNYDHGDTFKYIRNSKLVHFESTISTNEEYYKCLAPVFESYNPRENLSHLNVLLGVTKCLIQCRRNTPNLSLFGYLMDQFGICGLHNYQSIIYDNIPSVLYKKSLLSASGENKAGPKVAMHFQDIIYQCPALLESLINYQVPRNDTRMLHEFLMFFSLSDVSESEYSKGEVSTLFSKSRFLRPSLIPKIQFHSSKPVFAPVLAVYAAINACISLQQFHFIDILVDKLILHTYEIEGTKMVVLSADETELKSLGLKPLYLSEKASALTSKRLFTKQLFILLLKACRESDDAGRLMWLIPHLDEYLTLHFPSSKGHIRHIEEYLIAEMHESDTNRPDKNTFALSEKEAAIDSTLISSIHDTLELFGFAGKILNYDKMLNFRSTVAKFKKRDSNPSGEEPSSIRFPNHYTDSIYLYLNKGGYY